MNIPEEINGMRRVVWLGASERLDFYVGIPTRTLPYDAPPPLAGEMDRQSMEDYQQLANAQFAAAVRQRLASLQPQLHVETDHSPFDTGAGPVESLDLVHVFLDLASVLGILVTLRDSLEMVRSGARWVREALRALSTRDGQPAISNGMAMLLALDALADAYPGKDMAYGFTTELGANPPTSADWFQPEATLVGARGQKWLYLAALTRRGQVAFVTRVRMPGRLDDATDPSRQR